MRPGQIKRMRGRPSNNRRGPNPLTRSYESNGPDVKIRGNAHHVAEKYLQLARDAHTGGDPVAAENYLQHAEHYFRLIAAAQAAQALAQSGQARPAEGETDEFDDDDDIGGMSDRFASPTERSSYSPQQNFQPASQPAAGASQPYVERQPFEQDRPNTGERGGFQPRSDRQGNRFQDRSGRLPQPNDRNENFRDRQNRDNRPRDFRPYRETLPTSAAADALSPNSGLPSFITASPRPNLAESEGVSLSPSDIQPAAPPASPADTLAENSEARFQGRGRRRRLRSPYGFNASQGEADQQESPAQAPATDEPPINE